jgi:hypothetical protein
MHDIYDPPPARMTLEPQSAPLLWSARDLVWLGLLVGLALLGSAWAWTVEPMLWPAVLIGGLFVALESWFSALTFLHRHPASREGRRWRIFLAAVAPWCMGLGLAAGLLIGLFALTDWLRF